MVTHSHDCLLDTVTFALWMVKPVIGSPTISSALKRTSPPVLLDNAVPLVPKHLQGAPSNQSPSVGSSRYRHIRGHRPRAVTRWNIPSTCHDGASAATSLSATFPCSQLPGAVLRVFPMSDPQEPSTRPRLPPGHRPPLSLLQCLQVQLFPALLSELPQ